MTTYKDPPLQLRIGKRRREAGLAEIAKIRAMLEESARRRREAEDAVPVLHRRIKRQHGE